ncbi:MAG: hypothetical protein RIS17_512 [Pseudomonadota bacterium]
MIKALLRFALIATMAGAVGACATLSGMPVGNRNVPQPAKPVDVQRYLGRWYELYRFDAPFQKNCEAVFADYARNADGTLRVINSCRKGAVDGPLKTATGKARIVDPATGAKLKVSFFGPFHGDYWVLDRDEDYQWAIVGEPSGRYMWVLSREAAPSGSRKALLRRRVEELGYDWSLVRETRH